MTIDAFHDNIFFKILTIGEVDRVEDKRALKLLQKDNSELLEKYGEYFYSINDLADITGYPYQKIHNILNRYFPSYKEKREKFKNEMYLEIQRYIELGIPVDVFNSKVPLIHHLKNTKTLKRAIKRLNDSEKIFINAEPITLFKFSSVLMHIKIEYALIRNKQLRHTATLKTIASDYGISESMVFKINRDMNNKNQKRYETPEESMKANVRLMYKIYQLLTVGEPPSNIKRSYELSDNELALINKTFKAIGL